MNGLIAFANDRRGRYALRTEDGNYTLFELLSATFISIDEEVSGDLNTPGRKNFRIGVHASIPVFIENCLCLRASAARWVRDP